MTSMRVCNCDAEAAWFAYAETATIYGVRSVIKHTIYW